MSTLAPAVTETLVAPWVEWARRYTRGRSQSHRQALIPPESRWHAGCSLSSARR